VDLTVPQDAGRNLAVGLKTRKNGHEIGGFFESLSRQRNQEVAGFPAGTIGRTAVVDTQKNQTLTSPRPR
jgi:hypothetical protein